MDYVILGNSAAAVGCIEGIRAVDPVGKITVIASEKYHTYSRPLISYLITIWEWKPNWGKRPLH